MQAFKGVIQGMLPQEIFCILTPKSPLSWVSESFRKDNYILLRWKPCIDRLFHHSQFPAENLIPCLMPGNREKKNLSNPFSRFQLAQVIIIVVIIIIIIIIIIIVVVVVIVIIKNIFFMKSLTDFCNTVETGVDQRLGFQSLRSMVRSFPFIVRAFHSFSVNFDMKRAFWPLGLKNKVYT